MRFRFCLIVAAFLFCIPCAVYSQYIQWEDRSSAGMNHDGWILQTAFLHNGEKAASAGLDGRIRVWDLKNRKLWKELPSPDPAAFLTVSSPSKGNWIAAGDSRGRVVIYDIAKPKPRKIIQADARQVNALSVSADGKLIAAGGSEGLVRIYSADKGILIRELRPDRGRIVSVVFSPDQRLLVIGSLDPRDMKSGGEIGIWKWNSQEKVYNIPGAPAIRGLAISPDGRLLAGFSHQRSTRIFGIAHSASQMDVTIGLMKESDETGFLALWDLESGARLTTAESELGSTAVSFSPDGTLVFLAGNHGVIVYGLYEKKLVEKGRLESLTPVDTVSCSPDGKSVVLARRIPLSAEKKIHLSSDVMLVSVVASALEGAATGATGKGCAERCKSGMEGSRLETWSYELPIGPFNSDFWEAYPQALKGQTAQALRTFEDLSGKYPGEPEIFRVRAILQSKSGDLPKALSIIESAEARNAVSPMLYRSLGDLFNSSGEYQKAIGAYEKAMKLQPSFGLVNFRMAKTYAQWAIELYSSGTREKFPDCAALLDKAIQLVPDDPFVYTQAGAVNYLLGQHPKAVSLLHTAIALQPDYDLAYYNLGHCYRALGEMEKAIQAYQDYVGMVEAYPASMEKKKAAESERLKRAKAILEDLKNGPQ